MATKYFIAPNAWGIFAGMDKTARVDSRTVAEMFNKQHYHVLRDIENLDISEDFRKSNFGFSKYKVEGQKKSFPCYEMTLKKSRKMGRISRLKIQPPDCPPKWVKCLSKDVRGLKRQQRQRGTM